MFEVIWSASSLNESRDNISFSQNKVRDHFLMLNDVLISIADIGLMKQKRPF